MDTKIIEGIDIIDVVNIVDRKSRLYQAVMLQEIEKIVPKGSEAHTAIRKIILDNTSEYTRSILRVFFGTDDFEGKIE